MGGDNAPEEIVKGTVLALSNHPEADAVLVGREEEIRACAEKNKLSLDRITVVDAREKVEMEDDPAEAFRSKKDSSLCRGLKLFKEDGDVFISAGSTGALLFCATLTVRRMPGVDRPCIATVLPFETPLLVLDSGANIEVKPEYFHQWAMLGTIYSKVLFENSSPRVGMVNNGTEETKGTELQKESFGLLRDAEGINFVGNVEGREIPAGACDVLLCDGFTGNVVLKYTEGMAKMFSSQLKGMIYKSLKNKLAGLLLRRDLNSFKEQFNYKRYGGSPIIGLSKPVFKAHGNSDAQSFASGVEQAIEFVNSSAPAELSEAAAYLKKLKNERKKENV